MKRMKRRKEGIWRQISSSVIGHNMIVIPGRLYFPKLYFFKVHQLFELFFDSDIHLTSYECPSKSAGRPSPSKQSSSRTRSPEGIRFHARDNFVIQNVGYKKDLYVCSPHSLRQMKCWSLHTLFPLLSHSGRWLYFKLFILLKKCLL